jgi:integrase
LTGARLREVLSARWAYVDLDKGLLNLPDSKTGKKTIILSPGALDIIHNLPREDDHPYLIPGAKPGACRVNLHTVWKLVCAAADLKGVRIHDLRHTWASTGANANMGLPVIGALMGHRKAATRPRDTATYRQTPCAPPQIRSAQALKQLCHANPPPRSSRCVWQNDRVTNIPVRFSL